MSFASTGEENSKILEFLKDLLFPLKCNLLISIAELVNIFHLCPDVSSFHRENEVSGSFVTEIFRQGYHVILSKSNVVESILSSICWLFSLLFAKLNDIISGRSRFGISESIPCFASLSSQMIDVMQIFLSPWVHFSSFKI